VIDINENPRGYLVDEVKNCLTAIRCGIAVIKLRGKDHPESIKTALKLLEEGVETMNYILTFVPIDNESFTKAEKMLHTGFIALYGAEGAYTFSYVIEGKNEDGERVGIKPAIEKIEATRKLVLGEVGE